MEDSPRDIIKRAIDDIIRFQGTLLEMYAAAFVKEVGSDEASKYQLVEERSVDGLKTTWRFELANGS